jgi:WD40 repeat protein
VRLAFSPDAASRLLTVSGQTVYLWNVADRREERQLGNPDGSPATCLAFSPDGKTLATDTGYDGPIQLRRVADGKQVQQLTDKNRSVRALSFSPDGKLLAATGQQGHLTLWDLETGQASEPFPTEGLADGPLAFSPDGRTIATRGGDCVLHFWDRITATDRLATPEAHLGTVNALLFLIVRRATFSRAGPHTVAVDARSRAGLGD